MGKRANNGMECVQRALVTHWLLGGRQGLSSGITKGARRRLVGMEPDELWWSSVVHTGMSGNKRGWRHACMWMRACWGKKKKASKRAVNTSLAMWGGKTTPRTSKDGPDRFSCMVFLLHKLMCEKKGVVWRARSSVGRSLRQGKAGELVS